MVVAVVIAAAAKTEMVRRQEVVVDLGALSPPFLQATRRSRRSARSHGRCTLSRCLCACPCTAHTVDCDTCVSEVRSANVSSARFARGGRRAGAFDMHIHRAAD